jgi:glycosyltransferase involved in cell wall biosynthesis
MTAPLAPPRDRPLERGHVPTFSVIVVAFQAAETVGEAVESALAQTLPPHEVIVCDDGSTDDLEGALRPFGSRIRFLRQEHRGVGAARRTATAAASGEFLVVLDADDAFEPTRLEALGDAAAARPDLDVLTTDAVYEVDGVAVHRCYSSAAEFEIAEQRRAILLRNFIFGAAAVRRSRLLEIGGYDGTFLRLEDWDCWIRLLLSGSAAGLVHEPLYRYRIRRGSLSWDRRAGLRQRIAMLERVRTNPHLRSEERPLLEHAIAVTRSRALAEEAEEALLGARPDARRLLVSVAAARGTSARMRAAAVAALVAPGLAARRLRRRGEPNDWMFERALRSKL